MKNIVILIMIIISIGGIIMSFSSKETNIIQLATIEFMLASLLATFLIISKQREE